KASLLKNSFYYLQTKNNYSLLSLPDREKLSKIKSEMNFQLVKGVIASGGLFFVFKKITTFGAVTKIFNNRVVGLTTEFAIIIGLSYFAEKAINTAILK